MKNGVSWYFVNPKDGTEMVLVPGGWFWMGSGDDDADVYDDEKPRHLHHLAPFYISIMCITVAQFRRFSKETGHDAGSDWKKDSPEHPVRFINWHDARAYCEWAGLRLPLEPEWELAARGYGALKYPWGNEWEDGRRVCWKQQRGAKGESASVLDHPEGPSPFGTFQQSGNVWEWCEDAWESDVYQRYARGNLRVPGGGGKRVVRGAWWFGNLPRVFRGGYRYYYTSEDRYPYSFGLRPARTV